MSHFYGKLFGRSTSTAAGTKSSGLSTEAMTSSGNIKVFLFHNTRIGEDTFRIEHHLANGDFKVLARGIVGKGS